jgi:hypothetical protein
MRNDKDLMITRFRAIKALGYVKSNRPHNTGIGKTFEDYVGVVENNLEAPDFAGFEIKSHRFASQSYVTLFTKAPSFPKGANAFLKNEYGTPYDDDAGIKKLHTSMFADSANTYKQTLSFRLIDDPEAKMIFIGVFDLNGNLIDKRVGYTYDVIEKALTKKLNNLFYVTADVEVRNGVEYFHFNRADIYMNPSLDKFLNLLREGKIMYDIRIGSYKSGAKRGKPHDHGSGFRILEGDIRLLYDIHEVVE